MLTTIAATALQPKPWADSISMLWSKHGTEFVLVVVVIGLLYALIKRREK